ncbi:TRAP transporter small permease [Histidinibacterium lentulum]|uniref:TRAP transporter small permease protein n=1 Tax=Histidinibacterium lentulum TaxID=2480588 RepID=A0A3N2R8H1_9RHOB|nr:TRAP transporter small permease [Histidinibacterium lentulum]ROU03681.1 TRAP transporter small permease [Histidinibacterium lentulum]
MTERDTTSGQALPQAGPRGLAPAVLRPATRLDEGLARAEAGLGALVLLALIVVLTLQVASRQLPFFVITWTEETSRLLFGWLAFLGTAFAFQRNAHISISLLVDRAPRRLRAGAEMVVRVLIVGFAAIMLYYGLRLCLSTRMVTTVLRLPMWVAYAAIPAGGALMIVHGLVAMLRLVVTGSAAREAAR